MKERDKRNLETLTNRVYPLERGFTERQFRLAIDSAVFLAVLNSVVGLSSAIEHPSETLTVPVAIRPIRTVARSMEDDRRLWKCHIGITQAVVIDWTFVKPVLLNHALIVAISSRPIFTLVLSFRSLSDIGIGEACSTLIFGVVWG